MTKSNEFDNKKILIEEEQFNEIGIDLTKITTITDDSENKQNFLKIEPTNEIALNLEVNSETQDDSVFNEAVEKTLETEYTIDVRENEQIVAPSLLAQGQKGDPDEIVEKTVHSETAQNEAAKQKRIPIIPVISDEGNQDAEMSEATIKSPIVKERQVDEQRVAESKENPVKQKRIPIIPVIADDEEDKQVITAHEVEIEREVDNSAIVEKSTSKEHVHQAASTVTGEAPFMNKIVSVLIYVICFLILIICGLVLYGTLTNRLFAQREQTVPVAVVKQVSEYSSESVSESSAEESVKQTALVPRPKL